MPMPALETEQRDRTVVAFGRVDQRLDVRLFADVDLPARSADLRRNSGGAFAVEIRHRDMLRAVRGKPSRQRAADPARAAGDDDDFVFDLHRCTVGFRMIGATLQFVWTISNSRD